MAAAMELRCWGGDWGLPSVHTDSLVVLAYAKFSGTKLTVSPVDWTWKTLTASVPELVCGESVVQEPTQILNFLRKQRLNADYELTARQGADTMAYIALLEEKLRPALLHTFWVDAENYSNLTRPWFASRSPFPLNFFLPSRLANIALARILVTKGEGLLHRISEVEGKIYSDAKECLNLLSYRLGAANYFFDNSPTSLDAFVFGFLAPLHKADLTSSPLQSHLRQLDNLTRFCDNILAAHFNADKPCPLLPAMETMDANLQKLTQLVNKESNLIEKMDDNLRSSPQHKPHRPDPKSSLSSSKSSTPA
ncbi:metaxin-3 isoform X1 [Girardinichthys multiradiatus]|uniref:metaxin-3 isoform X1 n=1 Tax=Girardinichthys multiradiatus TaxID=208333 RepID=UPI001FACB436|nr:metaxin-3 isoform X1 [Girardinichthys multiradiatus]